MTLRARDPRFFEPLWNAEQARALDYSTITEGGIPGYVLMEHAGRAVADVVARLCNGKSLRPVFIVSGPGNNGGDGWVAGRHLWGMGIPALVLSYCEPAELKGDALQAAENYKKASAMMDWALPGFQEPWLMVKRPAEILTLLQTFQPHIIVDALLGTGLSRPLSGLMADWVQSILEGIQSLPAKPQLVAVDIPTGMSTDGAQTSNGVLSADVTVTFGGRKICHALSPSTFSCGEVINANIGLLPSIDKVASARAFALRDYRPFLKDLFPKPPSTAHKGDFGHVAVWLGSVAMQGAAHLAALGAHRAACGKVTLLGSKDKIEIVHNTISETLKATMPRKPDDALKMLRHFSALVAGPGLPQTEAELEAVAQLLQLAMQSQVPTIVDAGALQSLSILAGNLTAPMKRGVLVCTPHPKEASRLLKLQTKDIQADRLGAMDKLCELPINHLCHVIWVLKGACPILGEKQSASVIVPGGHPTLAVGGSGDVLAGILAALITRVPDPFLGAVAGVNAHQKAGQRLGARQVSGFLASEIADELQRVLFALDDAS